MVLSGYMFNNVTLNAALLIHMMKLKVLYNKSYTNQTDNYKN